MGWWEWIINLTLLCACFRPFSNPSNVVIPVKTHEEQSDSHDYLRYFRQARTPLQYSFALSHETSGNRHEALLILYALSFVWSTREYEQGGEARSKLSSLPETREAPAMKQDEKGERKRPEMGEEVTEGGAGGKGKWWRSKNMDAPRFALTHE